MSKQSKKPAGRVKSRDEVSNVKQLLLFPFGGNAREALMTVLDINKIKKEWDILGFIDDNISVRQENCAGVKVLGDRSLLSKYPDASILAVPGNAENYHQRADVITSLAVMPSRFARIIHPTAVVSVNARIGFNTLVMAHVVVGCGASVGNHCVILANTTIAHETVVEDFCCIGASVVLSGGVWLKSNCYIGSGTSVRDSLTVGKRSLIGLGSNVVKDIDPGVVAVGNPARPIRKI